MSVFEVDLPFFGVTLTDTLQDPFAKAFTALPETLHTFFDAAETENTALAPTGMVPTVCLYNADRDVVCPTFTVDC